MVGTFGTGFREIRVNLHKSAVNTQRPGGAGALPPDWTGFTPGLASADFSALSAAPRENPVFALGNGPPKPPKLPNLAPNR